MLALDQASAGGALVVLLLAGLQEGDADLVAIDPGELAAPVGEAGGRQQQEEFLQVQALDRALDRQLGAGLGDVLDGAVAPQVPSMPIMKAGMPRSKTTRSPFIRSAITTSFTHAGAQGRRTGQG